MRHNLHNFKLRLKALEARVASEGVILTEPQLQALERAHQGKMCCGRTPMQTLMDAKQAVEDKKLTA